MLTETYNNDTDLMLSFQMGTSSSLDTLALRHQRSLINHLTRMVGSRALAEDLSQDAFVRVIRAADSYRPCARFSTWLYHIATNLALNWRRDNAHKTVSIEEIGMRQDGHTPFQPKDVAARPDEVLLTFQEQVVTRSLLEDAMSELPERQRVALQLRIWEELPYEEIARRMSCTVPTVKSLLFRAQAAMRAKLSADAPRMVQ
ncbi:MAG: RNA polymerase sigma factor [Candidatus Solibacter usitatus]|nr:RNA polymerase sigma factor [Candidatus Solibacter usitatus]